MDLPADMVRTAKQMGCRFILSSDAHTPEQLGNTSWAEIIAFKAGLEKADVLNWQEDLPW
jgi:histidinol phosphatase-like PHP family hydrolase